MYPHVMTRLRQEVLDKVGLNGKPTMEAIKDMKYLRAVINGKCMNLTKHRADSPFRNPEVVSGSVRD